VSYAPDPNLVRILEFYCPGCGSQVEVQYLPPGHPIPRDIELDIDKLKEKYLK
jgi:acetophenone carboxylase